jgi:hypothetical protein
MKKEMEGVLGREGTGTQPALTQDDGKTRLVYNLFDGFTGKKVKLSIEEMTGEELEDNDEACWQEVEVEAGDADRFEPIEDEPEKEEGEGEEESTD